MRKLEVAHIATFILHRQKCISAFFFLFKTFLSVERQKLPHVVQNTKRERQRESCGWYDHATIKWNRREGRKEKSQTGDKGSLERERTDRGEIEKDSELLTPLSHR